jgi:uncharacterized protein YifE (UPF0438 family)
MNINEELNRIKEVMGLSEALDTKLTPEQLNSFKGQDTKEFQNFFNKYYKLNLPVDGNWMSSAYNNTMKKYIEEKKLPLGVCKKGDGYCNDAYEGEVYTKSIKELDNFMKQDMNVLTSGTTQSGQTQTASSQKINTTHDKTYDYKLENNKYYYSFKGKNSWIEAKGKSFEAIKSKVKF